MSIFSQKQPDLAGAQAAAAAKERERIAQEDAANRVASQQKFAKSQAAEKSKRQAFVSQLSGVNDNEEQNRRYLQAV